MKKILFICQANIGRSQMAEAFFNHHTNSRTAISAAVDDYRLKYDFRPTDDIVQVMKEKKIDISEHRMKIVTKKFAESAERTIILCDEKYCPAWLLKRPETIIRTLEDPFGHSIDSVREIRDQIETLVLREIEGM